jgi:glycosyltransferase involved in cell wall biosynthesis
MNDRYFFPGVTLLVTHYNRSSSLERLLANFRDLGCRFEDRVVSDDGSKPEHVEKLHALAPVYNYRLITAKKNSGLGNNINKGQDAVKTPYTLYIQEDFVPLETFPPRLLDALQFMNERPELDMARFYAYFRYPYLTPIGKGFSEMRFKLHYPGYRKFYLYSDHPHLRRSNFLQKFGRYREGVNVEVSEYGMMMSFLKNQGKAIYFDEYNTLLDQVNSRAEPSTFKRNHWRESNNLVIAGMRHAFRHMKFNYNYVKTKLK